MNYVLINFCIVIKIGVMEMGRCPIHKGPITKLFQRDYEN